MSDPVEDYISSIKAKELSGEADGTEFAGGDPVPQAVLAEAAKVADPRLTRCGHALPSELAKFCPQCGAPIGGASPPVGSKLSVEIASRVQSHRPKPEELLTEEERAERRRQHQAAVAAGARDVPLEFEPVPEGVETFLIHFIEDGFGAFGNVWYRGQELEVPIGSERWEEGWNQGTRWLQWQDAEQMRICGKVYFRRGPWPGQRSYADGAGGFEKLAELGGKGQVTGPSVEALLKADAMEARRRRGVPRPARV